MTAALGFNLVMFILLPALFHPWSYTVAAMGASIALLLSATQFVGSLIQDNRIWKPLFVGCILVRQGKGRGDVRVVGWGRSGRQGGTATDEIEAK